MGKWQDIYRSLEAAGVDVSKQLEGTAWLDRFIPPSPQHAGKMLDLGCGLGADMLRCAQLGFTPYGLDLEQKAVDFVQKTHGFTSQTHNFCQPLPFDDQTFSLVLSRLAVHYLNMAEAEKLFKEVHRILQARGKLLFVVNSKRHLELGLQYNYADALEVSPNFWHLPHDHMKRSYLFYTPQLAKELLGDGWTWHYLQEEAFTHWGIDKRVVIGVAEKR